MHPFRGREFYHSMTPWTPRSDKGRFCFVLTTHESIRKLAQEVQQSSAAEDGEDSCRAEEPDVSDAESSVEDWEWNPSPAEGDDLSSPDTEDDKEDATVSATGQKRKKRRRNRNKKQSCRGEICHYWKCWSRPISRLQATQLRGASVERQWFGSPVSHRS